MAIMTIGIGLARNVFAGHGVDENGRAVLIKPKVSRQQLPALSAQLPPCRIGMEACTGADHRARLFRQHGHTVRLIAPKFVAPYRMSGRNDAALVAITAKNARLAWAVLRYGEDFRLTREAARNHRSTASVDVKRVGPAPGVPD